MKRFARAIRFQLFFGDLNLKKLEIQLKNLRDRHDEFFSPSQYDGHSTKIVFDWRVDTSDSVLKPDSPDGDDISEFIDCVSSKQWIGASFILKNVFVTEGLELIAGYEESFQASIEPEFGSILGLVRMRTSSAADRFLFDFKESVNLSVKPIKKSRYIPAHLETKLLCDSLHLCNICGAGVVQVHHILPVEDGGTTEEENLVVLCPSCHARAHNKNTLVKSITSDHLKEYKRRHLENIRLSKQEKIFGAFPETES